MQWTIRRKLGLCWKSLNVGRECWRQCHPDPPSNVSRWVKIIWKESKLTPANAQMIKRTRVAQCYPAMVLWWTNSSLWPFFKGSPKPKKSFMNLLICRLGSRQVEGICWDRRQDDLCPGSDTNIYPGYGIISCIWPWSRYQQATLFLELTSIHTYSF